MFPRSLVGVIAVCISACAAKTPSVQSFNQLDVARKGQEAYSIVREGQLSTKDWTEIEREVMKFADRKIASFEGKPVDKNKIVKIHYRQYLNRDEARGGIVISSGRTEGLVQYQELIYDLVRNGYSVYIHDHRGQGFSGRLLDDDLSKGHIDDFEYYVADLKQFISAVEKSRHDNSKPLFLLAHSMGGAIASLYLEGSKTKDFEAAALVTPMHQPGAAGGSGTVNLTRRAAQRFCDKWAIKIPVPVPWLSTAYADGGTFDTQYTHYKDFEQDKNNELPTNDITHSVSRYRHNWETRKAECDSEHCGNKDAKVGGATYRWFNQACSASSKARGVAARGVSIPVLVLQGGKDTVVNPDGQIEFCDNVNNNNKTGGYCVGYAIAGARHAIFIEEDQFRQPALAKVLSFFDCVRERKERCP